jgi:NAD(P)-dependent dehydrogenase (short-subunit alcohol dehydrogenase family)
MSKALFTSGVLQRADPASWRNHFYGLTPERWQRIRNKSFWITGAGTGYGRCIAIALAAAGGRVFITGRRRNKLNETLDEMRALSIPTENCRVIECDITQPSDIKSACSKVISLSESLYGLVNNAALPSSGRNYPLQEDSLEEWEKMLRTNVTGHWLLTREIFAHMHKGGALRVLFMTSEAGWAATTGFGPYNVTKAALNSLTVSMAAEYSSRYPDLDLQINVLNPGEAKTEMNEGSTESPYSVVSMALMLLSHSKGGPNGRFFHRDGRHLSFSYTEAYAKRLI